MKLRYKKTSIEISADAFSNITNEISFQVNSLLSDGGLLNELFKYQFALIEDRLLYASVVSVPNMPVLFDTFKIEQDEVGMTVKDASTKWLIGIIFEENLLNLNKEDWEIII